MHIAIFHHAKKTRNRSLNLTVFDKNLKVLFYELERNLLVADLKSNPNSLERKNQQTFDLKWNEIVTNEMSNTSKTVNQLLRNVLWIRPSCTVQCRSSTGSPHQKSPGNTLDSWKYQNDPVFKSSAFKLS